MIDFAEVEDKHRTIHAELINWALWVRPGMPSYIHPMWAKARSNAWQWHIPEHRPTCNIIDAQAMEKRISKLPATQRAAVRWCYVWRHHPNKMARQLGVTLGGLQKAIRDGRQMLINQPPAQRTRVPCAGQ